MQAHGRYGALSMNLILKKLQKNNPEITREKFNSAVSFLIVEENAVIEPQNAGLYITEKLLVYLERASTLLGLQN